MNGLCSQCNKPFNDQNDVFCFYFLSQEDGQRYSRILGADDSTNNEGQYYKKIHLCKNTRFCYLSHMHKILLDVSSKARGISFGLSLHLYPCFVYASHQDSGESVHMWRPFWAFTALPFLSNFIMHYFCQNLWQLLIWVLANVWFPRWASNWLL